MELPLERAMRIQEALKPLGYAVHGFTEDGLVTVVLRPGWTFPYRKSSDIPGEIGDVGVKEPDNGLQSAK
jgi:hypothetical protein